ncbi:CYTH and CHAD domain-containing protein [Geodermatophilus sp. YIM 151500]|uniref:CYTH and CHAD domain-containing protein n=1 Tax=Geodermatophilus sp. YIM 151500 TaxID=2984531 RepID=UPI0021E4AE04|nr:CYTH and CHAD domain-containing protein [Geodermatophilus sp. YIM 151500]MCV2491215.1 CYTH and CHAD domain-containing protein [Geodermatophilus sp. YIM 151500]
MVGTHLEVERKFDVDPSFALPDLTAVDGVASADDPVEHRLEAVYHDTADLRLLRAAITLRRRTGGADAGWHLKLPASAGARREQHEPLGRAQKTPPRALRDLIAGVVRTSPTAPVATLRTQRLVTVLRDAEGRALAEVADDSVTASAPAGAPGEPAEELQWREVEVELVGDAEGGNPADGGTAGGHTSSRQAADGDAVTGGAPDGEALLAAVGDRLLAAGARPSAAASKLGRVLAARLAARADGVRPAAALPQGAATGKAKKAAAEAAARRGATGADVVLAAVTAQLVTLRDADVMVRTDQPDAVHKLRVACRRLRSILASFRTVLDREATDPLRAELRWLGEQLSDARDHEVALAHLRQVVTAEPAELVLGPVAARLQQTGIREAQEGAERASAALSDARYLRLVDDLHALVADPPLADRAGAPAAPVLRRAVRRSGRRLGRRLDAARGADDAGRGHALHELRKAAKRVRYTGEVAAGELGGRVQALVDCMEQVQDVLGERQDTQVTRELCRRLGIAAAGAGENAWTYGRLHGLEEARATRAEAAFWAMEPAVHRVLAKATKKR